MSKNAAMDFINELRTNVELYDNSLHVSSVDEMVEIAQKAGFDVTAEDLAEAEREARRLLSDESDKAADMVTLSSEELSDVSGGAFFLGEDASDGHEMGCFLSYHHDRFTESCVSNYYCFMNYYDQPKCHGPHND
jgi:predicted ribosomally synthesized peptide with nif11-like leader